VILHLYIFCNC